jgi:hypothetical protein
MAFGSHSDILSIMFYSDPRDIRACYVSNIGLVYKDNGKTSVRTAGEQSACSVSLPYFSAVPKPCIIVAPRDAG